jgi:hypothetical protein
MPAGAGAERLSEPFARAKRAGRGAPGMNHRTGGESPLGTLTEGTRHRRDKGVGLEHQVLAAGEGLGKPARGGLMEVIGARPFRAKAKRREASASGEPAPGGKARYPSEV